MTTREGIASRDGMAGQHPTPSGEGTASGEGAEAAVRLERMRANLRRIEDLTQRMTAALARRRPADPALSGPGQEFYLKAAAAWLAEMSRHPSKLIEQQVAYWGKTLKHYVEAQEALMRGELAAPPDPTPRDRRFANPLWETHPFFNFLKQQYFLNAEAITGAVAAIDTLPPEDRRRLDYFTRQVVEMLAPTNFLPTNPDALERALATDGESLVRGLENLVADLEANDGELLVTLADRSAFRPGENIAATPGAVVYRNRMIELIQYAPATPEVREIPLVIFPPWVNKYYVLDLSPANSLMRWIVEQGYTLFVVSWVNPDSSYRDTGMDDYIRDGFLCAIEQARRIAGTERVNAAGYCIGGTTLALTLAHMAQNGDERVNSATFFTTLTDFSDRGEIGVFLEDDFVDAIERQVARDGVLDKLYMARTFSFLRANDLVWQPAVRSYMLGETPPAFDLLYWNGDGTNLPARMIVEYLRGLCQRDEFARGGFAVMGRPVRLGEVKVPLFAVACETDHIAGWKSSFNGIKAMGAADRTFVLSQSGHIAGIVNPPGRGKYGHYTSDAPLQGAPEEWRAGATFHPGSWWPRWGEWLAARSGPMVAARTPGGSANAVLAPAPGTYVTMVPEG